MIKKSIIYTLKVSMDKDTYRVIEIEGNNSLEDLAECIISAFDFYMDHCYGFYENKKNYYASHEIYELFVDMEDCECTEDAKSVKKTKVSEVFVPKKTMLFLFDYGDEWEFAVKCTKQEELVLKDEYPKIIKSVGEAPEQYPGCDDENCDCNCEEEEDDEDDDDNENNIPFKII